jgi:3-deoxy-D-manno-octulosonic-acid transferase
MFIVYDLIFVLAAFVYLPKYLFRRKFHAGLWQRLGFFPEGAKFNRPIWIHAVSVGEAMAIRSLLEGLKERYPQKQFVISTVTATGNKVVQGMVQAKDRVIYLPLDLSFIVDSVIKRINPALFIIVETEIWPNLIRCLYKRKIPVITVNGRISNASFRGYSCIRPLFRPTLRKIGIFCVQSETDLSRLKYLGVDAEKIKVTGNMKFDIKPPKESAGYRQSLRLNLEDRLLVAGSTHPKEEEIILNVYKGLLRQYPALRLLIAPRHPERVDKVSELIKDFGFQPSRVSLLAKEKPLSGAIFILDTVGELSSFYAIADIVFIGGSLVEKGGHNILEPAYFAKPILFGPHMFNFRDIADLFLRDHDVLLVRNARELESRIQALLESDSLAKDLGHSAKEILIANQGATLRNLGYISKIVDSRLSL